MIYLEYRYGRFEVRRTTFLLLPLVEDSDDAANESAAPARSRNYNSLLLHRRWLSRPACSLLMTKWRTPSWFTQSQVHSSLVVVILPISILGLFTLLEEHNQLRILRGWWVGGDDKPPSSVLSDDAPWTGLHIRRLLQQYFPMLLLILSFFFHN